ncbi:hypothetical protein [Halomontanus rarus]|uniref:hypothetical protein n=1 Tax=Halomontanus rarus TaxID=3034020 RepID=UPI0023E787B9|nr:hypothetical protein [Halovivax sp. TS33]
MDGDGGGMDRGAMGGLSSGEMVGMNKDGRDGTESTDGDHPDSGTSALESMGYIDSGTGIDRRTGDSPSSGTSIIRSAITAAMMVFVGFAFVFFLLRGILAVFGVQL